LTPPVNAIKLFSSFFTDEEGKWARAVIPWKSFQRRRLL